MKVSFRVEELGRWELRRELEGMELFREEWRSEELREELKEELRDEVSRKE